LLHYRAAARPGSGAAAASNAERDGSTAQPSKSILSLGGGRS
jgi:hypothetical protein